MQRFDGADAGSGFCGSVRKYAAFLLDLLLVFDTGIGRILQLFKLGHSVLDVVDKHVDHIARRTLANDHTHYDQIFQVLRHRIGRNHPPALLQQSGWMVPAYTMPENLENLVVMRVVVRQGTSRDMIDMLIDDIKNAVAELEKLEYPTDSRIKYEKQIKQKGRVFTH